jgi:hypothetical protein
MNDIGHVKECHRPGNDLCPHNADPKFDCTCKSGKVVVRKPYREIRVQDATVKMHRISGNIVCRIFDNGLLVMREKGKRRTYETTIGAVYTGRVWSEAMAKAREKKAKRKGGRK